jgi:hypothetical protein
MLSTDRYKYTSLYLLRLLKVNGIGESQGIDAYSKWDRDHTHRMISEHLPTQNGLRAKGRSRPATDPDSSNLTPFSSRARIRRGTAAAVPLRVCAKASELVPGAKVAVSASDLR